MKLKKINEKENKILFLIDGVSEVFANTLRRLILEEVPTLAVHELEVRANNSALYDEMLALRLGLIPIKTDLNVFSLPKSQAEIDERSAGCTLRIELKSNKKGIVYAQEAKSADPSTTFVYPKMPIVKLLSKQKIDLTMTAVVGRGKDHIKWAPGFSFYNFEPEVNVEKVKDPNKLAKMCSDGVFELSGSKIKVNEDKLYNSQLLDYYAEKNEGLVVNRGNKIVFSLESWGQLECKEILNQCANILTQKIEELESLV